MEASFNSQTALVHSTSLFLPVELLSGSPTVLFHFAHCASYYDYITSRPEVGMKSPLTMLMGCVGQECRQDTERVVGHWYL